MKKVDTDALEKFAKQKNIDKDKIEKIADSYKGKSQNELMEELVKIGKTLEGKEEVVSKFKTFLDEDQRKKLDTIMNKISESEIQDKIESKKSKSKSSKLQEKSTDTSTGKKKVKKVKKVKKSSTND